MSELVHGEHLQQGAAQSKGRYQGWFLLSTEKTKEGAFAAWCQCLAGTQEIVPE